MSHIGEGELHAWLDGALDQLGDGRATAVREHLRSCAACREALVAEEGVRARAAEVLALATPRAAEAPPFEALLERARAGAGAGAGPARRMSRMARVGWAASVVIALGAGWLARDMRLQPDAPVVAERAAGSPEEAGPDLEAEGGSVSVVPVAAETAPMNAAADAPSEFASEASDLAAVGAAARPRPEAAAAGAEADLLERASPDRMAGQIAAGPPPPTTQLAEARAFRDPPSAPAPAAPARVERTVAPAAERVAATGAAARAEPQRREASGATQRAMTSAARSSASGLGIQQPGRDSVAGVPPLFTGRADSRSGAVSGIADADEAQDLIVPGLEVLYVEWSQLAPGQPMRRVLQRLANGDTLDLRFVRSMPRSAAADPLAQLVSSGPLPGWSEVVKVHGGGWLVARAPIAQEELEALVEQAGTR